MSPGQRGPCAFVATAIDSRDRERANGFAILIGCVITFVSDRVCKIGLVLRLIPCFSSSWIFWIPVNGGDVSIAVYRSLNRASVHDSDQ